MKFRHVPSGAIVDVAPEKAERMTRPEWEPVTEPATDKPAPKRASK